MVWSAEALVISERSAWYLTPCVRLTLKVMTLSLPGGLSWLVSHWKTTHWYVPEKPLRTAASAFLRLKPCQTRGWPFNETVRLDSVAASPTDKDNVGYFSHI
jgi:hypothetical protein